MSKIKLESNPSGTGTFTIQSPASSTDRTITLPDEAGTVLTSASDLSGATGMYADSDALSLFNASGSAPVYACRAWVNFNGTGTVAIRDSGNVSSITDYGTGDYKVNFSTAMPDANYSTAAFAAYDSAVADNNVICVGQKSTTSSHYTASGCRLQMRRMDGGDHDVPIVSATFFR